MMYANIPCHGDDTIYPEIESRKSKAEQKIKRASKIYIYVECNVFSTYKT